MEPPEAFETHWKNLLKAFKDLSKMPSEGLEPAEGFSEGLSKALQRLFKASLGLQRTFKNLVEAAGRFSLGFLKLPVAASVAVPTALCSSVMAPAVKRLLKSRL